MQETLGDVIRPCGMYLPQRDGDDVSDDVTELLGNEKSPLNGLVRPGVDERPSPRGEPGGDAVLTLLPPVTRRRRNIDVILGETPSRGKPNILWAKHLGLQVKKHIHMCRLAKNV